jgi:hypothetical protein
MRMFVNRNKIILILGPLYLSILLLIGGYAYAASEITEEWETTGSTDEWIRNTIVSNLEKKETGGNPGGYLYTYSDDDTYYAGMYTVKDELSGDFGIAPTIEISTDIKLFSTTEYPPKIYLRFRYHSYSYNGWRYLLTGPTSFDTDDFDEWITYSVIICPTWTDSEAEAEGWIQESSSPSFSSTMGDVISTEVRFENWGAPSTYNPEVYAGVDNFKLEETTMPEDIDDSIQDLPDDAFDNNAVQMSNALSEKLDEVDDLIDDGEYQEAIDKLKNDIRSKCDGSLGGNPNNDWVTDPDAQEELCEMIDDLIDYLESLL